MGSFPNYWVQNFGATGRSTMNNNNNISTTATNTVPIGSNNTAYMKPVEKQMVDEINLLRNNPSGYVRHVLDYVNEQRRTGGFPISQSVVNELVSELNALSRLSTLQPSECIYNIARKHGEDQKPLGDVNHRGRDGLSAYERITKACPSLSDATENLVAGPSSVRESVIILLIDEGIPNRGHRRALLNPKWRYVGCYKIGQVGSWANYWVQNFGS